MTFKPQPAPQNARNSEAGAELPAAETPPAEEPINILIVDDEPKNLVVLETILDNPGYRLVRAGSANEALLALVAEEFALLVLDIQMPVMNGFELVQMIKQRKKTAGVPIIFLTAYYSEDQHAIEGYSTGAVDYLHKPINATVLRSKVAVFAELHRKTRESALANRALLAEVAERRNAQEQLRELNEKLERRVAARTAELQESEARFRALAENMPHLVWETDASGAFIYQNAKWRAYTGLTEEQADEGALAAMHPEDAKPMEAELAEARNSGRECDSYCRYRRASDSQFRWFHVKAAPVRDASGAIVRWVGTGTDIHEQRQAEEAMREAEKRKDEFLAMLGHELRNPLAAIRYAVRMDAESIGDPEARSWAIKVIDRQSAQLTRMVDDLLDVERINRGRIDLRPETLNLSEIITRAVEGVQSLVEAKKHTITVYAEAGMHLCGDAARLEQVFVNLFSNAAKYTEEGGRIQVSARRLDTEALISISDNGVGLTSEVLPRIFDLFTQVHTSLDRAQGGLGIGLTVVKSLIEMHGGTITAQSEGANRGSTFTVRLPLLAAATELASAENGSRPSAVSSDYGNLPKIRVLVVDDHPDTRDTLSRLLTRRGCEVRIANNGMNGLAAALEFHPEVLLLDLGLPDLDGFALCRTLRANPEFTSARFIAISGYAQNSDIELSIAAGFDLHFAKPVDFSALVAAFRSISRPNDSQPCR